MINFRQKEFAEYDAMRSLYVELMRPENRLRVEIISPRELVPVLKGNTVVIERFVISTSLFNKDKYRMYLKIGAKAKMPDAVRFSSRQEYRKLGTAGITINGKLEKKEKTFGDSNDRGGKKKKKNNGGGNYVGSTIPINAELGYTIKRLSAETISYDIQERSLVLEVESIRDAISVLNVLPFGLNYKLYLVN